MRTEEEVTVKAVKIAMIECDHESTDRLTKEEAEEVLEFLEVLYAEELVEWYNVTELDADDLHKLANVNFTLITCDLCGEEMKIGWPDDWSDFQGVDQDEIGPVEINGKEKEVCAGCYEDNPVLW